MGFSWGYPVILQKIINKMDNGFDRAHPTRNGNFVDPDEGFLSKAWKFAKANPVLAVMAGMLVLGLIMPEKKNR